MNPTENSFINDVKTFTSNHKLLCVLTLGLAIVGYSVQNLIGRSVSWIKSPTGTTQRTGDLGNSHLNPTFAPLPPKAEAPNVVLNANITPEEIKRLTPDDKGRLIDLFAKRGTTTPSILSKAQLNAMVTPEDTPIVKVNSQERGLGHCGRYAINNALQREALDKDDFLRLVADCYTKKLDMSKENANKLVNDNDDFGVDTGILEDILKSKLEQPVKYAKINTLPDFDLSKQAALETYTEGAEWIIIANDSDITFSMPSSTHATYALARGHFIAARKDDNNKWWYIDSRADKPVQIDLALIPSVCTIIVPKTY